MSTSMFILSRRQPRLYLQQSSFVVLPRGDDLLAVYPAWGPR